MVDKLKSRLLDFFQIFYLILIGVFSFLIVNLVFQDSNNMVLNIMTILFIAAMIIFYLSRTPRGCLL